ncbi:MAG: 2Fe-2S iron-sulfur cluster-binding protein [Myxococcota bacterium]
MPSDTEFHPLTVARVIDETHDTRSFVLDIPANLQETFRYKAGQFCTFQAVIDGEQVGRCYSMSSSPDTDDALTVTVKRVDGGRMSNWMNDTLGAGDSVEVLRPAGLFVLRDATTPIVLFAGGSGITPILSLIKSALAKTERRLSLVYANKTPEDVILRGELERLRDESKGRLKVHHHIDADSGFLDAKACAEHIGEDADGDFYVCGPGPFMNVVEAGLSLKGVDPNQLFIERFDVPGTLAGKVAEDAGDAAAAEGEPDGESVVPETLTLLLGKKQHEIPYSAGDTILEAARRAGIKNAPFSCERGSCATCMAKLTEGSASMRVNNALEPDEVEEGYVLTCQALPEGQSVVVDYNF